MKALVIASVASMIDQFTMPNIKLLQKLGYEVNVACNFLEGNTCDEEKICGLKNNLTLLGVPFYQIDFARKVTAVKKNAKAYKQVKALLRENRYDLIHCHSPIGGFLTRLAARKPRKKGTKVIYTAHGFHFYKGAPLKNWLLFYPIEKYMSRYTDTLITINQEDYRRSKDKFHSKETIYVPGVGVDIEKFTPSEEGRARIRAELEIKDDQIILLSVGELNKNKNHESVIRAIQGLNIVYVIVGKGDLREHLVSVANECKIDLRLMGFRSDVADFYRASDIFAFPSIREGLGLAAIEGMACGLPLIVSDNRGLRDIVTEENGITCTHNDINAFAEGIKKLSQDAKLRDSMGKKNIAKSKEFSVSVVNKQMNEIYYS